MFLTEGWLIGSEQNNSCDLYNTWEKKYQRYKVFGGLANLFCTAFHESFQIQSIGHMMENLNSSICL